MQVLSELMPEQEVLSGVRNACLLVDPSCGTANYNAAMTGQGPSSFPAAPPTSPAQPGQS